MCERFHYIKSYIPLENTQLEDRISYLIRKANNAIAENILEKDEEKDEEKKNGVQKKNIII